MTVTSGFGTPEVAALAEKVGCTEMRVFEGRWRFRFASARAAKAHRARYGTGGWVLGPYLFPGTGWTPSLVMRCSEGVEGELE